MLSLKKKPLNTNITCLWLFLFSFRSTAEDLKTGMFKVLEQLKSHEDAWPFLEEVSEDYAPRYYSVIRKPMDLNRMCDKLDDGSYTSVSHFRSDFMRIIDNCRVYNGDGSGKSTFLKTFGYSCPIY